MQTTKIIFAILAFLLTVQLGAQSIERSTFDVAGGLATTDQFQVHYSLGQSFTKTIDLGDITVSEGFIQGSIEEVTTSIDLFPNMEVGVSPNPSFDIIQIRASQHLPKSVIMLFDVTGKMVVQRSFEQYMQIDVGQLPSGTYLLNWVDVDQRLIRSFKVMKI